MMTKQLFPDKKVIQQRFNKAQQSYDSHAWAQQSINQYLVKLLLRYCPQKNFEQVFEIGCGSGHLSRLINQNFSIKHWFLNDLCNLHPQIKHHFMHIPFTFLQGDIEQLSLPTNNDLIVSASTFQWLHHPTKLIQRCANHLNPKAYFLFNTFTPLNLLEIKQLTGQGLFYPSKLQWISWLEKHFDIIHHEEQTLELDFLHPLDVLKHLQKTGVTATQKYHWTPTLLKQFCADYRRLFSLKKGVSLTYSPLYFLVQKKH